MDAEILNRLEAIEAKIGRPEREYLSAEEAASFLGLSKQQLDIYRMKGGGPAFHKVGRRILYAVVDLRAWMAAHRREPLS